MTAGRHDVGPFKGPAYFTLQDRGLFFGRERDTQNILAMIKTQQISMVHAPSGSGKTSLLRARVLSGLDIASHDAIYCRPGDDPGRAVRAATLLRVVPPPAREAAALRLALQNMPKLDGATSAAAPDADALTLSELRRIYQECGVETPAYRDMVADVTDGLPDTFRSVKGASAAVGVSMVARLLILPNGTEVFYRYLRRLTHLAGRPHYGLDSPEELAGTSVGAILRFFDAIDIDGTIRDTLDELLDTNDDLAAFFRAVTARVSDVAHTDAEETADVPLNSAQPGLAPRITLIIDQFEEFFTLYGDTGTRSSGAGEKRNYEIRETFFDQLASLLSPGAVPGGIVRLAVSIRDDYLARMRALEARCGAFLPAQKSAVPMLSRRGIGDVVSKPAAEFGCEFEKGVIDALGEALAKEDSYILPIELQIVCDKLWSEHGRTVAGKVTTADLTTHAPPGGSLTDAVLALRDGYLEQALSGLPEVERMDALLVLSQMITFDGTREPVTQDRLENQSLANKDTRGRVLTFLNEASIISFEALSSNAQLAEVKHEFLIRPIQQLLAELRQRNVDWLPYTTAVDALARDLNAPLSRHQLHALWLHVRLVDPDILKAGLARRLFVDSARARSQLNNDRRMDWLRTWAGFVAESDAGTDVGAEAALPQLLADLASATADGSYTEAEARNVLQACAFFPDSGGAGAIATIARSDRVITAVKCEGLRLLLFPEGPAATRQLMLSQARPVAQQLVSQDAGATRAVAFRLLRDRLEADVAAGVSLTSLGDALDAAVSLAATDTDPEVGRAAQEVLRLQLQYDDVTVDRKRAALELLVSRDKADIAWFMGPSEKAWVGDAVRGVAAFDDVETWQLLARLRRDHGIAPPDDARPARGVWRGARRSDLWPVRSVQTAASAFGVAAMVAILLLLIPGQSAATALAQAAYGVVMVLVAAILALIVVRLFPPAFIFANRQSGLLRQILPWACAALLIAIGVLAPALRLFEAEWSALTAPGVWLSVASLFLALLLVRPLSFLLVGLWRTQEVGFGVESMLVTLMPLAILLFGAQFGVSDGLAMEAHALYFGGPIAAALGVTFLRLDSSSPDKGGQVSTLRPVTLTVMALTGLVGAAGFIISASQGSNERADVVGLPQLYASAGTEHILLPERVRLQIDLEMRQVLDMRMLQASPRRPSEHGGLWVEDINGAIMGVWQSRDQSLELGAGRYHTCFSVTELCQDVIAGTASGGLDHLLSWRAYIETIERVVAGRRPSDQSFVPHGFVRLALEGRHLAGDEERIRAFRDLIAPLDATSEGSNPGGFYVAVRDVTLGNATEQARFGVGSIVLLSNPSNTDGSRRALIVAAATDVGADLPLIVDQVVEPPWDRLRRLPAAEVAEALRVTDAFRSIQTDPVRHLERHHATAAMLILAGYSELLAQTFMLGDPPHTDDAEGRWFISAGGITSAGGGLFREVGPYFESEVAEAEGQGHETVLGRLASGWTRVPSRSFCYRFDDYGSFLDIPTSELEAWRTAIRAILATGGEASEVSALTVDPDLIIDINPVTAAADQACAPLRAGEFQLERTVLLPDEMPQGLQWIEVFSDIDIELVVLFENGDVEVLDHDPNRGSSSTPYSEQIRLDDPTQPRPVALCARPWRDNHLCDELQSLEGDVTAIDFLLDQSPRPPVLDLRPGAPNLQTLSFALDSPTHDQLLDYAQVLRRFTEDPVIEQDMPALFMSLRSIPNTVGREDDAGESQVFAAGSLFAPAPGGGLLPVLTAGVNERGPIKTFAYLRPLDATAVGEEGDRLQRVLGWLNDSGAASVRSDDPAASALPGTLLWQLYSRDPDRMASLMAHAVLSPSGATHAILPRTKTNFALLGRGTDGWQVLPGGPVIPEGCISADTNAVLLNLNEDELVDLAHSLVGPPPSDPPDDEEADDASPDVETDDLCRI